MRFLLCLLVLLGGAHTAKATYSEFVFESTTYGHSVEGLPLIGYKVYKKFPTFKRKAMLLSEGIHGNEYLGLLEGFSNNSDQQSELMKQLSPYWEKGGILLIAPQINPDGIVKGSRLNSQGIDLNREFQTGSIKSPESFFFRKWIDQELIHFGAELAFAADYHCCGGFILHPETSDSKVIKQIKKVTNPFMASFENAFQMGRTKDLLGFETHGTLKDYLHKAYGTLSFTVEAENMEKGFDPIKHLDWWTKSALQIVEDAN